MFTGILIHKHLSRRLPAVATVASLSLSMFLSLNSADAATTTTTVEAKIVSTINLTAQSGIVFGDIAASGIPGTVTIETGGLRTTTGGVTVNTSTLGSPAKYEVSGNPNAYFIIDRKSVV